MKRVYLTIQHLFNKDLGHLLKQLNMMSLNRRIEWIKRNKMEVFLTLYGIHTPPNGETLHLWINRIKELMFLQNLLDSKGVNYALIKTISLIPYIHADIDVLIDYTEFDKVVLELKRNSYCENRALRQSRILKFKKGSISIELHRNIEVLGLLQIPFECIGKSIEVSIDIYNKILNNIIYWKCPNLSIGYIIKLLDILDHKVVTIADLLELKAFSKILDIGEALFIKGELYEYPKVLTINEILLIVERVLKQYGEVVRVKVDILNLIKEFAHYLKMKTGRAV
ncbi:MAG: hypothetical protein QXD95_05710 [Nitrososphaeria archaeon]